MKALDIAEINETLNSLTKDRLAAKSLGESITIWAKWCRLFDKKEALEEELREEASEHEL